MRTACWFCLFCVAFFGLPRGVCADIPQTPNESPYIAPPGKALLVFFRPRKRLSEEVLFSIVDERGRCIGILGNDWKVAAPLTPGTQKLMVVTGVAQPQVQLLKIKVAAGKTYFVKMRPRVNAKSPVDMTVLRRGDDPVEAFPAAILDSSPFKPDLRDCTAWVAGRRAKLATKASKAKKKWNADEAVREQQTVRAADGWTAEEVRSMLNP